MFERDTDYFKWDSLTIGLDIKRMDDEHKVLIAIMNQLHHLVRVGAEKHEVLNEIKSLLAYSKKHFADEEEYMQSVQYPGLDRHRSIHTALIKKLEEHLERFESGANNTEAAFFEFLKTWLVQHIQKNDRDYSNFVHQGDA